MKKKKVFAVFEVPDIGDVEEMSISGHITVTSKNDIWFSRLNKVPVKEVPKQEPVDFMNYWYNQGYNKRLIELFGEEEDDE